MRLIIVFLSLLGALPVAAQVVVDVDAAQVRAATGAALTLADMSVNDTVYFYRGLCVKDDQVFAPSTIGILDLAATDSEASGTILRVKILPARAVEITIVDAAQAQLIAKGQVSALTVLSEREYANGVLSTINGLFDALLISPSCDVQAMWHPLEQQTLFAVSSINGESSLSGLLSSVSGQER